jgi:cold shock CspA family protein
MAGSQETFGKQEREKKRAKKRKEKEQKRLERKEQAKEKGSVSEFVYVDAYGNLTDTPPDPTQKIEIDADDIELGIPKKEDRGEDDTPIGRQGKVSFFDDSKGFGFIIDDQTKEKFFVHISGTLDKIQEEDVVTYELERGMKGMNAVRVKKV